LGLMFKMDDILEASLFRDVKFYDAYVSNVIIL
jgi:hypothetical protein